MNCYAFADIKKGLSESFSVVVTEAMMKQFESISGDINPLHTDRVFATGKGFPDKVVYGMLTASFYSTLAGVYLPGKYALLQGVNATFHSPVFPEDKLTIFGEVTDVNEVFRLIELRAHIVNQEGIKVSRARIKVSINE